MIPHNFDKLILIIFDSYCPVRLFKVQIMNSLTKRKANQQKENLNRLSNSKMINAYFGSNLPKLAFQDFTAPFMSTNLDDKPKNSTKRTARLKTGRKHQMSMEYIISGKGKEAQTVRNTHQQSKPKSKLKKKVKNSNNSSKLILPFDQFSRSNSLIVFSQKQSTINPNLLSKQKKIIYKHKFTAYQAATVIQKTWRGYLTRKLLDQYILEQQSKLNSARKRINSREQSLIIGIKKEQEMDFSSFSSINDENIQRQVKAHYDHEEQHDQIPNKSCHFAFTSNQTNKKQNHRLQSRGQIRSFFKNAKTQPSFDEYPYAQSREKNRKNNRSNLSLSSSVYEYSFCNKFEDDKINQILINQSLRTKIQRITSFIEKQYRIKKKNLREKASSNDIDLQQMILRNNKLKQLYENSDNFLQNVFCQLNIIVEEMENVVNYGIIQRQSSQDSPREPRSQLFTFDDDKCPQIPVVFNHIRQGQLKLQQYVCDLLEQLSNRSNETTELQFLCQVLKVNSERGFKDITERCLLQFTVELITQNIPLEDIEACFQRRALGESKQDQFVRKWIEEINKWEMGPIQEVTQAMESSSFINAETSKSFLNEEK